MSVTIQNLPTLVQRQPFFPLYTRPDPALITTPCLSLERLALFCPFVNQNEEEVVKRAKGYAVRGQTTYNLEASNKHLFSCIRSSDDDNKVD